ncbi:putative photosynthetic complex assembly protein PuhE [Roseomonas sp. CAU 1739]|uniref:putative photosynthetic complex assembly protein PuhE n=1 Tax=Roseomonas sp. CAU 1739 TaxID=3140364 RepID=UPI00325BEE78
MVEHLLPALFAMFLWWGGTGVILVLDGLRRETFRWTLLGATVLLAVGLAGLSASATSLDPPGAYVAFTCAILVWAWIEVTFLTGLLTGPSKAPCPPGARGWPRFRAAVAAILWHELAILAGIAVVIMLAGDGPNRIGLWTFLMLAAMRLSAKLNIFLGVRNLGEALLPDHLRYIESYFARRPMNALFPVSVVAGVALCTALVAVAAAPGADAGTAAGFTLLASLAAFGVLEHAFMILPFPPEAMWRWLLPAARRGGAATPPIAATWPAIRIPNGDHRDRCGAVTKTEAPPPHGSRT